MSVDLLDDANDPIDPDIWTVLNTTVSIVAAVGQLASLTLQMRDRKPIRTKSTGPTNLRRLEKQVKMAIADVEDLMRLVQNSQPSPAMMASRFSFGASQMMLPRQSLIAYGGLVQKISSHVGEISLIVTDLLLWNDDLAFEIGQSIAHRLPDLKEKVQSLYHSSISNDACFEICLRLLREMYGALILIRPAN